MLVWHQPDGEEGASMMLDHAMNSNPSLQSDVPILEFEEAPTAKTMFSRSADPRWQRIRPVYVW
jgi:hypothetical protein